MKRYSLGRKRRLLRGSYRPRGKISVRRNGRYRRRVKR